MKRILHLIISAVIVIFHFSCNMEEKEKDIIAKIGDKEIDWQLLYRSFNLDPKWGKGLTRDEAYKNQLNFLVDQKLFALAEEQNFKKNPDPNLQGYLEFILEKELIKELYRQQVASKIEITDAELQEGYRKTKIRVKYEFIKTPDSLKALQYSQSLKTYPINQIQLTNSVEEEKGISPMVKFGEVAQETEELIFSSALGDVVGPVKIDNEYIIMKIIDGEREKFISDYDFAENKSKVHKVILDRKAAVVSERFIRELMKDKNVRLNPPVFNALAGYFSTLAQSADNAVPVPIYMSNSELNRIEGNVREIENEPLVYFGDNHFTVREFLTKLSNMPTGLRPQMNMAVKLKKAIGVIVRNYYLAQMARDKGLDRNESVLYEFHIARDEALARNWLHRMQNRVIVTQKDALNFKKTDKFNLLVKKIGKEIDNQMTENILFDMKFAEMKLSLSDSLRTVYQVNIDNAKIMQKIEEPEKVINENPLRFVYREEYF